MADRSLKMVLHTDGSAALVQVLPKPYASSVAEEVVLESFTAGELESLKNSDATPAPKVG